MRYPFLAIGTVCLALAAAILVGLRLFWIPYPWHITALLALAGVLFLILWKQTHGREGRMEGGTRFTTSIWLVIVGVAFVLGSLGTTILFEWLTYRQRPPVSCYLIDSMRMITPGKQADHPLLLAKYHARGVISDETYGKITKAVSRNPDLFDGEVE